MSHGEAMQEGNMPTYYLVVEFYSFIFTSMYPFLLPTVGAFYLVICIEPASHPNLLHTCSASPSYKNNPVVIYSGILYIFRERKIP